MREIGIAIDGADHRSTVKFEQRTRTGAGLTVLTAIELRVHGRVVDGLQTIRMVQHYRFGGRVVRTVQGGRRRRCGDGRTMLHVRLTTTVIRLTCVAIAQLLLVRGGWLQAAVKPWIFGIRTTTDHRGG